MVEILRSAYQNRSMGDYDAFVEFNMEDVLQMLTNMKEFVFEIEKQVAQPRI